VVNRKTTDFPETLVLNSMTIVQDVLRLECPKGRVERGWENAEGSTGTVPRARLLSRFTTSPNIQHHLELS
jgi:hypothetical protein